VEKSLPDVAVVKTIERDPADPSEAETEAAI
jgi:hypothetical protein